MTETIQRTLTLTSAAFEHDADIPQKYSCEADNVNPPLEFENLHGATKALAIIVEDPDAPSGDFIHWLCWNVSPHRPIQENSKPGVEGKNGIGKIGYTGPCPSSGKHRYVFTAYALDSKLNLKEGADKKQLLDAMQGHILAKGELMGYYQKASTETGVEI